MHRFKPVLLILKNKFIVALTAFIVWMFFFNEKDWGTINARTHKLKDLKKSEFLLTAQIRDTKKELMMLKANAQTIEKYAREKFYMKKDNEDLFIVKTNDKE